MPALWCAHDRSYEARHVTDAGGQTWDYYSLNGSAAMAPTGRGAVICRACGTPMHAHLITSRRQNDEAPSAPEIGRIDAAEAARAVADGVEALIIGPEVRVHTASPGSATSRK